MHFWDGTDRTDRQTDGQDGLGTGIENCIPKVEE